MRLSVRALLELAREGEQATDTAVETCIRAALAEATDDQLLGELARRGHLLLATGFDPGHAEAPRGPCGMRHHASDCDCNGNGR